MEYEPAKLIEDGSEWNRLVANGHSYVGKFSYGLSFGVLLDCCGYTHDTLLLGEFLQQGGMLAIEFNPDEIADDFISSHCEQDADGSYWIDDVKNGVTRDEIISRLQGVIDRLAALEVRDSHDDAE
ncbi:hypothetical protein [Pseudoxanthomonas beigongshangi]